MDDTERDALALLGIPEEEYQEPGDFETPTLMQQIADASGWTDRDLGQVLGVGATAVTNYRAGIRRFRPVPAQRDNLRALMVNQIALIREIIETLDKTPTR